MPFFLILIAAILAVAAFNDAQGTLATQLEEDVPQFGKWALAIFGVGVLGWIPGMHLISRWLLALVFVVLVVKNYVNIIAGFKNATCGGAVSASAQGSASTSVGPTAAYIANPNNPAISTNEITGTGSVAAGASSSAAASVNAAGIQPMVASPYGAFDPTLFLAEFAAGFGGFGGVV